ncbi:hypothetical protein H1Z61_03265 [Bacillus aquiflavi]|uniref:Uncharacterized protein n=1 Tax=Bacillus aquiflavi TaxID=2672567 RepID=A0A6B3W3N2_9BACI|nr:hypothetical protein [Bacillus aquiflavi]MBA4536184.1 hypothetical protein [Bacillus aquiflavi]NEY83107.1 hypothetical protein [Bacillus aquiflavi]UAC46979.1 hypothetical protein K6959_09350 [Bacillus aquiflavi]
MFDPTAYENMKVVLEGALYDRDLADEIAIIDRDDIVNLAKLSRFYKITFKTTFAPAVTVILIMKASLENLSSELLPKVLSSSKAGCEIIVQFLLPWNDDKEFFIELDHIAKVIWGAERTIKYKLISELQEESVTTCEVTLLFNRLVYEEQIDDLVVMIDYMVQTVRQIDHVLTR